MTRRSLPPPESLSTTIDVIGGILGELHPKHARAVLAYLSSWYEESSTSITRNVVIDALRDEIRHNGGMQLHRSTSEMLP